MLKMFTETNKSRNVNQNNTNVITLSDMYFRMLFILDILFIKMMSYLDSCILLNIITVTLICYFYAIRNASYISD